MLSFRRLAKKLLQGGSVASKKSYIFVNMKLICSCFFDNCYRDIPKPLWLNVRILAPIRDRDQAIGKVKARSNLVSMEGIMIEASRPLPFVPTQADN